MKTLIEKIACKCGNTEFSMECVAEGKGCGINLLCTRCDLAYCHWSIGKDYFYIVEKGIIEQELESLQAKN